jgi:hypothetical protein
MSLTLTPDADILFGNDDTYEKQNALDACANTDNEPYILQTDGNGLHQTRRKHIPCRRELLVMSLVKYYNGIKDKAVLKKLVDTMQGNGEYSLRLIDVFVTNYAKKHNTAYMLDGQEFLVYLNYKSQTKAYSKKLFDPFCRHDRIIFQCEGVDDFLTTVGQMNFFRWAHEKGILDYIAAHVEDIRKEEKEARKQNGSQSSTGSEASTVSTVSAASSASAGSATSCMSAVSGTSASSSRRRRSEKVPASMKMLHKHDVEVTITFD